MFRTILVIFLVYNYCCVARDLYTNSFLVRFKRDVNPSYVNELARRHGFLNLGDVLESKRNYHFKHYALPVADSRRNRLHIRKLRVDPNVHYVEQQVGFRRDKRGYQKKLPNDPYFESQWYLMNTGKYGGIPDLDLNVNKAWQMGYTGKNVTTAIMDDGIDYMHPDLKDNFNSGASYDFSSNDPFPYPRYTDDWFNSHGTRCAGEIVSVRDNNLCGVGVAYDSKVAGIRMLDQPYMTDLIEASSMGYKRDLIDIYSASWGPTDDGKTVDGPRNATLIAILNGINKGRNGLGNIYVWASGDGGLVDDCNCDGYAASMWTISINSATNNGHNAHYDESCSSTLASTFSSGSKQQGNGVATTDLYGQCTKSHSGTSAAAPQASGVFALTLEANPKLTWRDMQHLVVLTSRKNFLYDKRNQFRWVMNGVGLEYNHLFGFGSLDAAAMVTLAKDWVTVPLRFHCEAGKISETMKLSSTNELVLKIHTNSCKSTANQVNFIEHVQAIISINASRRGDLQMFLTSPMGTDSMILSQRPNDDDMKDGFVRWPFMTTHTWGEFPEGTWTLTIRLNGTEPQIGFFKELVLMIHGTNQEPYKHINDTSFNPKLFVVTKFHYNKQTANFNYNY